LRVGLASGFFIETSSQSRESLGHIGLGASQIRQRAGLGGGPQPFAHQMQYRVAGLDVGVELVEAGQPPAMKSSWYPFRGRDVGSVNPPLSGIALRDQIAEQML
jgi:hypothetical protein